MKNLIILLMILPGLSFAEIYKSTDRDGNVTYTDIPPEQYAEELELPEINITHPPPVSVEPKSQKPQSKLGQNKYHSLDIVQPSNDEVIRDNAGNIVLAVRLSPRLFSNRGDKLYIEMDGNVVNDGVGNSVSIRNVDRGTHTVSAYVMNENGTRLKSAQNVIFHLKRYSKSD